MREVGNELCNIRRELDTVPKYFIHKAPNIEEVRKHYPKRRNNVQIKTPKALFVSTQPVMLNENIQHDISQTVVEEHASEVEATGSESQPEARRLEVQALDAPDHIPQHPEPADAPYFEEADVSAEVYSLSQFEEASSDEDELAEVVPPQVVPPQVLVNVEPHALIVEYAYLS